MILERFAREIDIDGTIGSIQDGINSGWFTKRLKLSH